ncbi:MAG TPA: hypothetical protein VIZ28_05195 [Chitinophagaceae bacterium]
MKKITLLPLSFFILTYTFSQNVGIGTTTPNSSAQLDVQSTTKGMLPPRMTSAQRNAIVTPANGLLVYDTDQGLLYMYSSNKWCPMTMADPTSLPPVTTQPMGGTLPDNAAGWSVSVSGNYAIAGAPNEDVGSDNEQGAVYFYMKANGGWVQQQRISPVELAAFDHFGHSVDISGDYAIVGAPYYGTGGGVFIYHRNGAVWQHETTLTTTVIGIQFGSAISIDGDRMVVGSPNYSSPLGACGAMNVYHRNGNLWTNVMNTTSPNAVIGGHFGFALSMRGNLIIVGAPEEEVLGYTNGRAYVYVFSGGNWILEDELPANSVTDGNKFGASVDVTSSYAIVGMPTGYYGNDEVGKIAIYRRFLVTLTNFQWEYISLQGMPFEFPANTHYATSIAFTDNTAEYYIVGAPDLTRDYARNAGACYVYKKRPGEHLWDVFRIIATPAGMPGDMLGYCIGTDGNTLIAGMPRTIMFGVPGSVLFADISGW